MTGCDRLHIIDNDFSWVTENTELRHRGRRGKILQSDLTGDHFVMGVDEVRGFAGVAQQIELFPARACGAVDHEFEAAVDQRAGAGEGRKRSQRAAAKGGPSFMTRAAFSQRILRSARLSGAKRRTERICWVPEQAGPRPTGSEQSLP